MSQMLCFHCANKMETYIPLQAQKMTMNQTASVLEEVPVEWENPWGRDTGTYAEHPPSHLVRVRNQLSTEYRKPSCASLTASRRSPDAPLPGGRDKADVGCPQKQTSSLRLHKAINTRLRARLPIHWLLTPFCPHLSKVDRKEEDQI